MIDIGGAVVSKRERVIDHCLEYSRRYANRTDTTPELLTAFTAPTPSSRNANLWLNGADLSSTPVWVYTLGQYSQGTRGCLITPQHHMQVAHNALQVGDTLGFLGTDDELYIATIASTADVGTDLRVNKFEEPLPAAVVPAKILPTGDPYFTAGDFVKGVRAIWVDRALYVRPRRWIGYTGNYIITHHENMEPVDSSIVRLNSETTPSGTTGTVTYLIINNQTVLLGCNVYSGLIGIHNQRPAFDAAMVTLGSNGYSVSIVDLSGFLT
jgi:hypothetical protein